MSSAGRFSGAPVSSIIGSGPAVPMVASTTTSPAMWRNGTVAGNRWRDSTMPCRPGSFDAAGLWAPTATGMSISTAMGSAIRCAVESGNTPARASWRPGHRSSSGDMRNRSEPAASCDRWSRERMPSGATNLSPPRRDTWPTSDRMIGAATCTSCRWSRAARSSATGSRSLAASQPRTRIDGFADQGGTAIDLLGRCGVRPSAGAPAR